MFGDEAQTIKANVDVLSSFKEDKDTEGKPLKIISCKDDYEDTTIDNICSDLLPKAMAHLNLSPFKALRKVFPSVCPKAFIDSDSIAFIEMEGFCRDYHVPPLGAEVGYLDYPIRMVEGFTIVNDVREKFKLEEMRSVQSSSGGKT